MVRRLPSFFSRRFLAHLILAFTLALAVSGIAGGVALAAPAQSSVPVTPHIHYSSSIYWNMCGGSSNCYGNRGTLYGGWSVSWSNGPGCCLGFTQYWGDGGTNTYTCFVNCGSGYWFPPSHSWNQSGTFSTQDCADACSNTVFMHIT